MKLQSFQQMLLDYRKTELDSDDKMSRDDVLVARPFSVILEGGYFEFESLDKWIEINLGSDSIKWLFYGKTGYDYGFVEYFFSDELDAQKVAKVAPNIYTVYPNSYPSNKISKSNGYDEEIVYVPLDKDAIFIGLEPNGK